MTAARRPAHPRPGWTRTALRRAIGALHRLQEETMRGSEAIIFRPAPTPRRRPRADAAGDPPGREAPPTKRAGRVA
jgi:hypothetical protein